jgi:hypothetical protein
MNRIHRYLADLADLADLAVSCPFVDMGEECSTSQFRP